MLGGPGSDRTWGRDWRRARGHNSFLQTQFSSYVLFCRPSQESTFTGKNCSPKEQILPFQSRPYFERAALSRKANRRSQKLFPFVKMIENNAP